MNFLYEKIQDKVICLSNMSKLALLQLYQETTCDRARNLISEHIMYEDYNE